MDLLRRLSQERGESFAYPATSAEASEEIKRLLARKRTAPDDRRRETREVREAMASAAVQLW